MLKQYHIFSPYHVVFCSDVFFPVQIYLSSFHGSPFTNLTETLTHTTKGKMHTKGTAFIRGVGAGELCDTQQGSLLGEIRPLIVSRLAFTPINC